MLFSAYVDRCLDISLVSLSAAEREGQESSDHMLMFPVMASACLHACEAKRDYGKWTYEGYNLLDDEICASASAAGYPARTLIVWQHLVLEAGETQTAPTTTAAEVIPTTHPPLPTTPKNVSAAVPFTAANGSGTVTVSGIDSRMAAWLGDLPDELSLDMADIARPASVVEELVTFWFLYDTKSGGVLPTIFVAANGDITDSLGTRYVVEARPFPPAQKINSDLPDVTVQRVSIGEELVLSSLAPSDRPMLLWFWSPDCDDCRREASSIERFARDNQNRLKVVGVGTLDSFSKAQEFVSATGMQTADMLWEGAGNSWLQLGVYGQPSWMLLDSNGQTLIDVKFGAIDKASVMERLNIS